MRYLYLYVDFSIQLSALHHVKTVVHALLPTLVRVHHNGLALLAPYVNKTNSW